MEDWELERWWWADSIPRDIVWFFRCCSNCYYFPKPYDWIFRMSDNRVRRIILFRTTEILLYSICWLQESWILNLSASFLIVKSDDSLTLCNIKSKNSLAEDTGRTLRRPSEKHAWSKLRKTSRCSIARLFNTKRVITPCNVLHVHRLKWPNFTASPRICMRPGSFVKLNITTTYSLYEVKLYLAAAVLCTSAGNLLGASCSALNYENEMCMSGCI